MVLAFRSQRFKVTRLELRSIGDAKLGGLELTLESP
jgi:hypothetical protein